MMSLPIEVIEQGFIGSTADSHQGACSGEFSDRPCFSQRPYLCVTCLSGETECQRRGLRCSEQGEFLPAQPDFLSGGWRCVSSVREAGFDWTMSDKPLTDDECSG